MDGRVLILSDTHLGRPCGAAKSAEALRPLWRGMAHVVVNGDVAELHHPDCRKTAAAHVMRLFDLCEADGVELTLLSGNHDPFLSDIRHLHLADDRIFITHGDVLHPAIAPWMPTAPIARAEYHRALSALEGHERDQLAARLAATQHAAQALVSESAYDSTHTTFFSALRRPFAVLQVMRYWRKAPRLAAAFAAQHAPRAAFVIIGHSHRAGIWTFGARTVINTGCFGFPSHPRAVVLDGQHLHVHRIETRDDAYALAEHPLRSYAIDAYSPDAAPSEASVARNTRPGNVRPRAASM